MARLWNEGFEFGDLLGVSSYSGATVGTSNPTPRTGSYRANCQGALNFFRFNVDDKSELYVRTAIQMSSGSSGTFGRFSPVVKPM
jgi:hypothetical protein